MTSDKNTYDFIVGIPRSGTTLLSAILNRDSETLVSLENRASLCIIEDFENTNSSFKKTKSYLEQALKGINRTPLTVDQKVVFQSLNHKENSIKKQCIELAKNVQFLNKKNKNVHRFLEKNPGHSFKMEFFLSHFPDAKFIWMTRDYRGFVNSRIEKKNPKNKIHNPLFLGYVWNEYHLALKQFKKQHPDRILIVRYEDLVESTAETVKTICSFIEIPFSEELLRTEAWNIDQHVSSDSERIKTKFEDLSKSINNGRSVSWKNKLTPRIIGYLDIICKNQAKVLGYATDENKGIIYRSFVRLISFHWYLGSKIYSRLSSKK